MIQHVADLEETTVLDIVRKRLAHNDDPLLIVEDCHEGLRQVGMRYERQEYFISGLIMAGEIFRQVMEMVQPYLEEQHRGSERGTILLGTVAGDIHDIGKNNVALLLQCYGFSVTDLGVDVPPERFLDEAQKRKPDIVGLSGLLTSSYESMEETITLLRHVPNAGTAKIPVIIGGAQINEEVCRLVGADYWSDDAMRGIRLCQKIISP